MKKNFDMIYQFFVFFKGNCAILQKYFLLYFCFQAGAVNGIVTEQGTKNALFFFYQRQPKVKIVQSSN